jgi:NAD(P)-dependent dehydrogenase (short-subunit alcohol dehydrogenase family)
MGHIRQKPIGSGWGARTTAAQIVSGHSLAGRRAVVTGGYSGLGLETVRALARIGAEVIVPARRPDEAKAVLAGVPGVRVMALDLSDLGSVAALADLLVGEGRAIRLLINNAAIMASPLGRNAAGRELQFATNHLGHFALTLRLMPLLAADGARVVCLSSVGHKLSPVVFEDVHFERRAYDKWAAYGQAKTANSLFAIELDRRGEPFGVRAFAAHPGGIMTPLQRFLDRDEMVAAGWIGPAGEVNEQFKTPEQGAATTLWCALSPDLDGKGGVYCEDCDIARPVEKGLTPRWAGVMPYAVDPEAAERLWGLSEAQTELVSAFP